jgi:hypothetical protein
MHDIGKWQYKYNGSELLTLSRLLKMTVPSSPFPASDGTSTPFALLIPSGSKVYRKEWYSRPWPCCCSGDTYFICSLTTGPEAGAPLLVGSPIIEGMNGEDDAWVV